MPSLYERAQAYTEKARAYVEKAQPYAETALAYAEKAQPYAETALAYAEKAQPYAEKAQAFVKNNPRTTAAVTTGVIVAIAPEVVIVPILGPLGFTSGGVAAGSTAAGIQAGIGNVAASSTFAFCQSAAAGGYGAATVGAVGGYGAAVVGAAAVLRSFSIVKAVLVQPWDFEPPNLGESCTYILYVSPNYFGFFETPQIICGTEDDV
ncbi:hypothetical protein K440DRAFT_664244 [Wilcoxina mikolae CBS 423.85]|nr:hypothetical protein K440DRAFT_664244 [Wilcoxina mikolae CBS 423.85]